jgi:hypothetical protein
MAIANMGGKRPRRTMNAHQAADSCLAALGSTLRNNHSGDERRRSIIEQILPGKT